MREISEKISGISEWKAEISWISESKAEISGISANDDKDFWEFCE